MRCFAGLPIIALLMSCLGALSHAQDRSAYPTKPIRVIVPVGAGAGMDVSARITSEAAEKYLGQRLVIENKPGAGSRIGASLVARSPADGYTLLFSSPTPITVTEHFPPKLDYNPGRDFAPVTIAIRQPILLITRPSLPVKSIPELIAYAKANPGKISFGVQGLGSDLHLRLEIFKKRAGINLTAVPYNAAAQAIVDLLADRLDAMFLVTAPIKGHVGSGRLLALATLNPNRVPDFPDVPTMSEMGLAEMTNAIWFGYLAPAGTPPAVIERLVDAFRRVPSDPAAVKRVSELGAAFDIVGPREFAKIIDEERNRFAKIVAEGDFARPNQ